MSQDRQDVERRLQISLVPEPQFGKNLRKYAPGYAWTHLCEMVQAEQDYRCAICDSEDELECHEHWVYDDVAHIQLLDRVVAICQLCHGAIHMGWTRTGSRLSVEEVISHYMLVNGCDRSAFDAVEAEARKLHRTRSAFEWTIDFGKFAHLIVAGYSRD